MDSYKKTAKEVLNSLGVDSNMGLNTDEVNASREKNGTNSFGEGEKVSLIKRIWNAITEPMLILLLIAAFITVAVNVANYARGSEYNFIECVGIFVAIALCVVITVVTEGRSAKAFEELNKINEDTLVKVIRNGEAQYITQREVVVGDILLLETGDKIVADGRLVETQELSVDESTLTGESDHVTKDENFVGEDGTQVADRKNMVYSGCFVSGGTAKMVVTAVGQKTEFGLIAGELSSVDQSTTPLQEKLDRMGKMIAILGIIAAVLVLGIQIWQMRADLNFNTVSEAFITSIVLIVAAVPEGLPTIVAVSLALNIIKMTRENALVKKMVACETIGCVNIICSDKTGTLTENKMTVQKFFADDHIIEANELKDELMINNCAINSNANLTVDEDGAFSFVGNPTECALLVGLKKSGFDYEEIRNNNKEIKTFPFSSQKKLMTRIVENDGQLIAYMKGSPERVIDRCSNVSEEKENELTKLMASFQEKAGRLIAFAHKELDTYNGETDDEVEKDFIFDGFAVISDPVSDEVYASLRKCRKSGIEVKMLTGDNIVTAKAIANELNLLGKDGVAVEAKDIDEMSDEELVEALKKIRVIARSTPMIKMRVVRLLKDVGNVVAVTGDGINDAPAIKHADVGIAMGIAGTEVTKEASDIVLLDDSFNTIVKAVKWGRGIYENFKRFIQFQLTVNVSSVIVIICSIVCGFKSPFTALELLWINIIMDGPPALTLGLEPMRDNLFDKKPTKRNENIISKKMLTRIMLNGVFISVIFMIQLFTNFLGATPAEMATVLFTLFVLFQLFNAFNCRELDLTPMYKNILKNKLMLGVFLIVLAVQFVITQFGRPVFGTVALNWAMWGKILLVAFSVIIVNEIVKLAMRLFKK
ncbi:MAG: calcium-translocating P-type ATPase, PMCA-type [Eubacterium sp.]|nr:calcium-translocating P-type ATPase, PMCA-type [Eubacterium sp.]